MLPVLAIFIITHKFLFLGKQKISHGKENEITKRVRNKPKSSKFDVFNFECMVLGLGFLGKK